MQTVIQLTKLTQYSDNLLFSYYKSTKSDIILYEIYKRTYINVFQLILPFVANANEAMSLTQEIYRIMHLSLSTVEKQSCLRSYLKNLIDNNLQIRIIENALRPN